MIELIKEICVKLGEVLGGIIELISMIKRLFPKKIENSKEIEK